MLTLGTGRRRICSTELIRQQTVLPPIPEVTPLSGLYFFRHRFSAMPPVFSTFLEGGVAGMLSSLYMPTVQQSYRYAKDTYTSLHGTAVVSYLGS